MKRLFLILVCLFWASFVFADVDTIEGTATSDTDTYEGSTNIDTFEGNTIASSGSCSGTYGHTTEESTINSSLSTFLVAHRVALGCAGTVSSISVFTAYCNTSDREMEFAIYSDNGSGTDPDTLLGNYGVFYDTVSVPAAWVTDSSISEAVSGDYIWVATSYENDINRLYYTTGTTPYRKYVGTAFSWPSTWPTSSDIEGTRDTSIKIGF